MKHVLDTVLLAIFGLLLSPGVSYAQKEVIHQSQYWLRYYALVNLNSKLSWHNEIDSRYFFANSRQAIFIAHSRLAYKLNDRFSVAAALCYARQKPLDAYAPTWPATPELRPWQEVNFNQRLSARWSLGYRLRIEERFINNHPVLFDSDYSFVFRHRYRIQLTYLIKKANLTFRLSEELFEIAQHGDLFGRLDQKRAYLSVEKRLNPHFSVEAGYLKVYQPAKIGPRVYDRDNLRMTLYHTIRPL